MSSLRIIFYLSKPYKMSILVSWYTRSFYFSLCPSEPSCCFQSIRLQKKLFFPWSSRVYLFTTDPFNLLWCKIMLSGWFWALLCGRIFKHWEREAHLWLLNEGRLPQGKENVRRELDEREKKGEWEIKKAEEEWIRHLHYETLLRQTAGSSLLMLVGIWWT